MTTSPDAAPSDQGPPSTAASSAPGRARRGRALLSWKRWAQAAGLVAGVALLVWAISLATSEKNRESFEAMRAAPASEVALLVGLTVASLVLNGLMFWVALRPVARLRAIDVVATNSISTFLSVLPFKLSVLARMLIHHRRDGVPLRTLLAWVASVGALGLAVLLPCVVATLVAGRVGALWWTLAIAGVIAANVMAVVCGRLAERVRWLRVMGLGTHVIVRDPHAVGGHLLLRVLDVGALAGRFLAAAAIADLVMPLEQAILLSTAYFLLSVITPAGTLGFREAGTAALASVGGLDAAQIALVALIVTGAEVLVSGVMAAAAFVWIRPDRLLRRGAARTMQPEATPSSRR